MARPRLRRWSRRCSTPAISIPTVINGGIINAYGTNARIGSGSWMVVEADESDGTFLKLPADVAIVTNVDPEHLDHFKTFNAVKDAFKAFVENVPFYGFAVMCTDHPGRESARRTHRGSPRHHLWRKSAGRRARDQYQPRPLGLDVLRRVPRPRRRRRTRHQRSQAADAGTAQRAECDGGDGGRASRSVSATNSFARALANFAGVKRRFTRTGSWNGVTVIDDYGHHPVEIAAVLKAARESTRTRSSPSCSRIATRACNRCSSSSAPASTMRMR